MTQGQRIARALLKRYQGKTKRDIALMIGASPQLFAKYERGTASPKADKYPRIADALGVEVTDLLEGKAKASPTQADPDQREAMLLIQDLLDLAQQLSGKVLDQRWCSQAARQICQTRKRVKQERGLLRGLRRS